MDKYYFEYIMKINNTNYGKLSNDIGINRLSLMKKVKGETEFKVSEMKKIKELFKLDDEEFLKIFFLEV